MLERKLEGDTEITGPFFFYSLERMLRSSRMMVTIRFVSGKVSWPQFKVSSWYIMMCGTN